MARLFTLSRSERHRVPRGERRLAPGRRRAARAFRSALPRGERHAARRAGVVGLGFRSALPRGERRSPGRRARGDARVSIRAPARGATVKPRRTLLYVTPFRSALPRGERPPRTSLTMRRSSCFDPRSRAGSDLAKMSGNLVERRVSIRAPARGATRCCHMCGDEHRQVSIRAPARGATFGTAGRTEAGKVSIRAPARGATRARRYLRLHGPGFDPRSRAGSDRDQRACPVDRQVSIRAPARGAT